MFVSLFFIYLSLLYYLCFLANKDAHKAVILCKTRSIITVKSNDLGPTARLTSVSFVLKRVGRVYLLFASNSITQHQYVGRRTVQPPQWECTCRGRPRLHVAGQRVVGVLKVARGRRSTSMVSVSTVSYRRPWSVRSVPRHAVIRV